MPVTTVRAGLLGIEAQVLILLAILYLEASHDALVVRTIRCLEVGNPLVVIFLSVEVVTAVDSPCRHMVVACALASREVELYVTAYLLWHFYLQVVQTCLHIATLPV